jgi:hypothetical protein
LLWLSVVSADNSKAPTETQENYRYTSDTPNNGHCGGCEIFTKQGSFTVTC